jgi:steroid delta-isomerase-like uncharacterized protein
MTTSMSQIDKNKEIARQWLGDFWDGNMNVADEIVAPNCIFHTAPPGISNGPEGLKQWAGLFFEAFTDVHLQAADMIAEDHKVTARFTGTGNHTKGPFIGYKANGKGIFFVGVNIFYIIDNKITEHWIYFEVKGLGENP